MIGVAVRRLRTPTPDRHRWRVIKASNLRCGDVVASQQLGGVDSITVLGDQVLVESRAGLIYVFTMEDKVMALVVLDG